MLILLFTLIAGAQEIKWTHPEKNEGDFKVTGYYLQYQISETKDCDLTGETPYLVDMKFKDHHDLEEDPNFRPGFFYFFRMSSYNEAGQSMPTGAIGGKDGGCLEVKGKPKMEEFEIDENANVELEGDRGDVQADSRRSKEVEKVSFDMVPLPASNPATARKMQDMRAIAKAKKIAKSKGHYNKKKSEPKKSEVIAMKYLSTTPSPKVPLAEKIPNPPGDFQSVPTKVIVDEEIQALKKERNYAGLKIVSVLAIIYGIYHITKKVT
jgi:hypothetical protein